MQYAWKGILAILTFTVLGSFGHAQGWWGSVPEIDTIPGNGFELEVNTEGIQCPGSHVRDYDTYVPDNTWMRVQSGTSPTDIAKAIDRNNGYAFNGNGWAHEHTWGSRKITGDHQVYCRKKLEYVKTWDECGARFNPNLERHSIGEIDLEGAEAGGLLATSIVTSFFRQCRGKDGGDFFTKTAHVGITDQNNGDSFEVGAGLNYKGVGLQFPITVPKDSGSSGEFDRTSDHATGWLTADIFTIKVISTVVIHVRADGSWFLCAAIRSRTGGDASGTLDVEDAELLECELTGGDHQIEGEDLPRPK